MVSRDEHEKIKDGYKVITKENVKEYDYDRIIILTGRPEVAESIMKDILNASDEEINDHGWMRGKISQYGIYPFGANARSREINWTEYGLNQVLKEFAGLFAIISEAWSGSRRQLKSEYTEEEAPTLCVRYYQERIQI